MKKKFEQLEKMLAKAADFDHTAELIEYDQETVMPDGGSESRGHMSGTVQEASHNIYTSDEVGKLLEELFPWAAELDQDSYEARYIMVTQREVERKRRLPAKMVVEKANLTAAANKAWVKAREKSEWPIFEPHMEKIVDYMRRVAQCYQPYDHIYDPLFNEYEPGMKTTQMLALFDQIRPQQIELVKAIAKVTKKNQVNDAFLKVHYPEKMQLFAAKEVVTAFGYDFGRGRSDKTIHPFSTNLGYGDQRITYRVDENFFNSLMFAFFHEAGHGMYEQGVPESLARTPLYGGTSLSIHESQSRMWENLVGRSKSFWTWYFPQLQRLFPKQLGLVNADEFYRAVNKVEPSFIRVEADEATYNLHVMMRTKLEIGLLEGTVKVKDLPDTWNGLFEESLGITPKNDAVGVLQDVHWSFGLFGYFPTYTLGNLVSAQLWEAVKKEQPNLESNMENGDFSNLLSWSTDKIYQHGKKFSAQELVKNITGSNIDGQPYIDYLNKKFGDIYHL